MRDYVYTVENNVHSFRFLDSGQLAFRDLANHVESIIAHENPSHRYTYYLFDLRLSDKREPMYEMVRELRRIANTHPHRIPTALAIIARDHPLNHVLHVVVAMLKRRRDCVRIFTDSNANDVLPWLDSV